MIRVRKTRFLGLVQRLSLAAGIALLAFWSLAHLGARVYQASAAHALSRETPPPEPEGRAGAAGHAQLADCYPVGKLEIPRIGLSAVIVEGTGDLPLALGVGHLRGSALPGDRGDVVLAGHRDTFFRPIRNIRVHDLIRVSTSEGSFSYEVTDCRVVSPEPIDLARASAGPELTLITCFPFNYLGHAPYRFVVQASPVERPAAPLSAASPPATATLQ